MIEFMPIRYKYFDLPFRYRSQHSDLNRKYTRLYVDSCVLRAKEIKSKVHQAQRRYEMGYKSAKKIHSCINIGQRIEYMIHQRAQG